MREREDFLHEYRITEDQFKAADISWDMLIRIYEDYSSNERQKKYKQIAKEVSDEIFANPKAVGLHYVYSRIKDPEHLIAKIIRKRTENYYKYKDLDVSNYWKIVRDLIGVRGLIIFKDEWCTVDQYINKKFTNNREWYIPKDNYKKYDSGEGNYLAEPTKAFIREGDDKELYVKRLGSENIISKQNYRSIHYILKYHGVCVEFQVRTLFEEALAEMDHKVRYPIYRSNEKLNRFSGMMNQLVGLADDLGAFYMELKETEENSAEERCKDSKEDLGGYAPRDTQLLNREGKKDTPEDCLDNILRR